MKHHTKRIAGWLFLLLFIMPAVLLALDKRLRVIADRATVHINPDKQSVVVATLKRGDLLTLGSARKFRKNWDYVYFVSEQTGRTKSGYILDSLVERLFEVTKVLTIHGDRENAPEAERETGTRPIRWGVTREAVLAEQGRPIRSQSLGGEEILTYSRKVLGRACLVQYVFNRDRLIQTKYSFLSRHPDPDLYLRDYEKLKDQLILEYGSPEKEEAVWRAPELRADRPRWGWAVAQGHLVFRSRWEAGTVRVELRLSGEEGRISLVAAYTSPRNPAGF